MNLVRSDQLASLQAVLVECRKSIDYFNDAADFVDEPAVAEKMLEIAESRDRIAGRLERIIRESDDLPTHPDPDRETGELLFDHARAIFSEDKTRHIVQQRLETERQLLREVAKCHDFGAVETAGGLLKELDENVRSTIRELQNL